jgi:hypothetical protein
MPKIPQVIAEEQVRVPGPGRQMDVSRPLGQMSGEYPQPRMSGETHQEKVNPEAYAAPFRNLVELGKSVERFSDVLAEYAAEKRKQAITSEVSRITTESILDVTDREAGLRSRAHETVTDQETGAKTPRWVTYTADWRVAVEESRKAALAKTGDKDVQLRVGAWFDKYIISKGDDVVKQNEVYFRDAKRGEHLANIEKLRDVAANTLDENTFIQSTAQIQGTLATMRAEGLIKPEDEIALGKKYLGDIAYVREKRIIDKYPEGWMAGQEEKGRNKDLDHLEPRQQQALYDYAERVLDGRRREAAALAKAAETKAEKAMKAAQDERRMGVETLLYEAKTPADIQKIMATVRDPNFRRSLGQDHYTALNTLARTLMGSDTDKSDEETLHKYETSILLGRFPSKADIVSDMRDGLLKHTDGIRLLKEMQSEERYRAEKGEGRREKMIGDAAKFIEGRLTTIQLADKFEPMGKIQTAFALKEFLAKVRRDETADPDLVAQEIAARYVQSLINRQLGESGEYERSLKYTTVEDVRADKSLNRAQQELHIRAIEYRDAINKANQKPSGQQDQQKKESGGSSRKPKNATAGGRG